MIKRVILTALFFILMTGLFGLLNRPALAQSCSTTEGWQGTCTLQGRCNWPDPNIVWDGAITVCKALNGVDISTWYGCCGQKSGTTAPENTVCTTTKGWPGTCTLQGRCNWPDPNIVWDGATTVCKAFNGVDISTWYGCCGANPAASCITTEGWNGTCTHQSNCNTLSSNIIWDNTSAECKALGAGTNPLTGYGCCGTNSNATTATNNKICDFAGDKKSACETCMGNGTGAWTALGCIPTKPELFIGKILGIGVGIGGGIAFLLILFGGFQILMSAGNPEKLNAGKELITSAITGLLIIVFSIFILRLIGVDIFGIPGFK